MPKRIIHYEHNRCEGCGIFNIKYRDLLQKVDEVVTVNLCDKCFAIFLRLKKLEAIRNAR